MSVNEKMTAIANAIRMKTGKTNILTLDQMAEDINNLSIGGSNSSGSIPADIKAVAMDIVRKVEEVRQDDSIVFMAISDSHHTGEQSNTGWQTLTNLGNLHAGMAAKVLSYALNLDFVCHLGDITFGHGTTTSDQLHQQIREVNGWLDEAWKDIPRFQTVGNHDTGYYAYENSGTPMESNEYLFSVFGKYCEGAVYGSEIFGYCYRDFEDKKLRVICLNTSEGDSLNASYECSPEQILWFAQTLVNVGAKTGWSIIVLGHYPLDYVGMHDVTSVVKAYIDGSSITVDETVVDFGGSNNARFVANFHGHTHCFKVAKLNTLDVSSKKASEYAAWRVGIPNSGFYRNNHQKGPNVYGLYFEEETTYDKVNDGVHDTAFVVNVITPSEEVIHSFCYGAGYDRAIGYGDIVYHKIERSITNADIDNHLTSIEDGLGYTAVITPDEHCAITTAVVTMNGVDITSTAYSEGKITIPEVTGDVIITINAEIALACTNQIPISTDADGNIYNGIGYKEKMYMSTGSESGNVTTDLTGFIPCKAGDILRMKNIPFNTTVAECRLTFFKSDKTYIAQALVGSYYIMDTDLLGVKDADGNYIEFTLRSKFVSDDCAFVRISAANITAESIVTINEEIKYADEVENTYSITYNLTNTISSNNSAVIVEGEAYNSTITAKSGYLLDSVTVIMGGVDISSTAYDSGVISIDTVTGDIIITSNAILDSTITYTNQLPISTDADGNIYNGKGYKEDTYLSAGIEGNREGIYTTGFIPIEGAQTIYFKNCGLQANQSNHRVSCYDSSKTHITNSTANTTQMASIAAITMEFDDNGYMTKLIRNDSYGQQAKFIRFCCGYLGEDSIVTVNEEIA